MLKRKFISLLTILTLVTSMITPVPKVVYGSTIVEWSEGITGGAIYFDKDRGVIARHSDDSNVTYMNIPNQIEGITVTGFAQAAFQSHNNLVSVTLPNTIKSISYQCFDYCKNLKSINIPNSVESIGAYAFEGCDKLQNITIPGSVDCIDNGTFLGCDNLERVVLMDGVKTIDTMAFWDCKNLSYIFIPSSVNSITNDAFGKCDNIVIYGCSGSYAETYANENGIRFVSNTQGGYAESYDLTNESIYKAYTLIYGDPKNIRLGVMPMYMSLNPPYYVELSKLMLEDNVILLSSQLWAAAYDEELRKNPQYLYEAIIMGYLKSEQSSKEIENILETEEMAIATSLYAITADVLDITIEEAKEAASGFTKEELKKILENAGEVKNYGEALDKVDYANSAMTGIIEMTAKYHTLKKVQEEKIICLKECLKNAQQRNDKYMVIALNEIITQMESTTNIIIDGTVTTAWGISLDFAWNSILSKAPASVRIGLAAIKINEEVLNLLFNTSDKAANNMKLLVMFLIDLDMLTSFNNAFGAFQNQKTEDSAKHLISCFKGYVEYQIFALEQTKSFVLDEVEGGLADYILKLIDKETQDTKDFIITTCDNRITVLKKILGYLEELPKLYCEYMEYECDWDATPHIHNWDTEYTIDKASTCTEEGKKSIHCKTCTATKNNVEIAVKPHTETTIPGKAATCTTTGLTTGKKCTVCNTVTVKQKTIAATGHKETTIPEKAATCTTTGLTTGKKCTVCNTVTVKQKTISAIGHKETNISGKAATCTTTGLTTGKKCAVCNTVTVKQKTISATGHKETTIAGKPATCTLTGLSEGIKCSVCGLELKKQTTLSAKGHTGGNATCKEKARCTVCGDAYGSLGEHTVATEPIISPTCTTDGLSSRSYCSVCKEILASQTVIPAKGHTGGTATCKEKAICTVCDTVYGELAAHNEITIKGKEATCIEMGLTDGKKCSVCGTITTTQRSIEKTTHSFESTWTIDKQASKDAVGSMSHHCKHCTVKTDDTPIPKISTVSLSYMKTTYNGSAKKPIVMIKDSKGNILEKDTDYTVFYASGRTKVGRYEVTVYFGGSEGKYKGSETLYFTVVPKAPASASANLSSASSTSGYDDIKFTWKKSTGATGYLVYYKKSNASKYTLLKETTGTSVTKKNLDDGVKYTFKVVPYYKKSGKTNKYYSTSQYKMASVYTLKKVSSVSVSKSGTKVKVKWASINGETGYQISKSTKKSGTNIVSTYKTTSGKSKLISVTKGKTYYYKVRAYKVVDDKKIYGPWSEVKVYKR